MAKKPARPSAKRAPAKRPAAAPKAESRRKSAEQPKIAAQPGFTNCAVCQTRDTCAFEGRCDAKERPSAGRPSEYSQDLADSLIEWMSNGKSLRSWCDQPGAPAASTIFRWLGDHPDFAHAYARAREAQADAIFDECLDIADDKGEDWIMTANGPKFNKEAAQRSRIRVETRLKVAARLNPRKYAERMDVNVQDDRLTDEQVDARLAALIAKTKGGDNAAAGD